MRGSKNLSTIIGDQRKYRIATGILVCLPDMVKSSVRLLGITGAELVEEVIQDGWGGQADLSFDGLRIRLCTCKIKIGVKQVDGTILEGDAEDVTREFLGRHEANVVWTKECGEMILLPVAIHQVSMTLWQLNIIFYVQGSNPRWVQGDKTCKIEVQLDSNKPDLLLATIGDLPVLNWQKDSQIGSGGCVIYLLTSIVVKG
jgi:hypothetical protein